MTRTTFKAVALAIGCAFGATAFAALDFSTKNDATDYQSGDVFRLDRTVANGRIRSASELRCAFVGTLTGAGDDVAGRSGEADLETSGGSRWRLATRQ